MVVKRSIASLFTGRFEPLRASLSDATLDEVERYLRTEAEFVGLQKPAHTFLARIFWNTVLVPVLNAYREVALLEVKLADIEKNRSTILQTLDTLRLQKNAPPESLVHQGREYDYWTRLLEARQSELNKAQAQLDALLHLPTDDTQIQHVQQ